MVNLDVNLYHSEGEAICFSVVGDDSSFVTYQGAFRDKRALITPLVGLGDRNNTEKICLRSVIPLYSGFSKVDNFLLTTMGLSLELRGLETKVILSD